MFDCLKSDPNRSSKGKLTSETESALVKVDEALNDQLIRINITKKVIKLFLPQNRMLVTRRPIGSIYQ